MTHAAYFDAPQNRRRTRTEINDKNQHISKPVRVGKVKADGMFEEVFATPPVEPDPFLEKYDWAASLKKPK